MHSSIKLLELHGKKDTYLINPFSPISRNHSLYPLFKDLNHAKQSANYILEVPQISENFKLAMRDIHQHYVQYFKRGQNYYIVLHSFNITLAEQLRRINKVSLFTKNIQLSSFLASITASLKTFQNCQTNSGQVQLVLKVLDPTVIALGLSGDHKKQPIFDLNCIKYTKKNKNEKGKSVQYRGIWYLPPQFISDSLLTPQSNIWSFGAILYEILSRGEKFIEDEQAYLDMFDPRSSPQSEYKIYMNQRIKYLQYRLSSQNSGFNDKKAFFDILNQCLAYDESQRIKINDLHVYVEQQTTKEVKTSIPCLSSQEALKFQIQTVINLTFQHFRLSFLNAKINEIFISFPYHSVPASLKVLTYILLKFLSVFYINRFCKAYQKAQKLNPIAEYSILDLFVETRYFKQFKTTKDEITQKISQIIRIVNGQKQRQLWQDIMIVFPQYADRDVYEPHKVAYEFCYRYSNIFSLYPHIAHIIRQCLIATRPRTDHPEFKFKQNELKGVNVRSWTTQRCLEWWNTIQAQEKSSGFFLKTQLKTYLLTIGVEKGSKRHMKYEL